MSLEYAILGFLNYRPLSGYDLKKVFDNSVRHFWPADQSQIYRTLAKLAEQGYVEQEIVRGLDRPDRKEYRITPAGQEALHTWLLRSSSFARSPYCCVDPGVLRRTVVRRAGPSRCSSALAAAAQATLAAYDQIPQPADADDPARRACRASVSSGS